jgi:hypothetical protein
VHARRLHHESTTTGKAGEKKPHVRKQVPRQERIAAIARRRRDAKIPDEQRYRPKWVIALEQLDELAGWVKGANSGSELWSGAMITRRAGSHGGEFGQDRWSPPRR